MPSNDQPSNDQPTNEQRRLDAKRKLEQRLETQQAAARKRKIIIASSSVIVVLVVAAAVTTLVVNKVLDDREKARYTACAYTPTPENQKTFPEPPAATPGLPAAQQVLEKQYADNLIAGKSKQRTAPMPADRQLKKGDLTAQFTTNQGPITMTLDRSSAPCNVAALTSLIKQKYYDNTTCHRLTEGSAENKLTILQCGDPTGTGAGAPGWSSPDEFPTDLKVVPQTQQEAAAGVPNSVIYPRGTVAIANNYQPGPGGQATGANTGSAQMFLVINDSQLPPNYSVVGKIDDDGLKVLDKVYKGGVTPGVRGSQDQNTGAITYASTPGDGPPKLPVDIKTVTVS